MMDLEKRVTSQGGPGLPRVLECLVLERGELGGGFQYFLFSSLFGEDSHFD